MAATQYAQDYDERVAACYNSNLPYGQQFWFSMLQPYCRSPQIFYCPSDTVHQSRGWAGFANSNVGYGWNMNWLQNNDAAYVADNPGVSLAQIAQASETVIMADNKTDGGGSSYLVNSTRYGGATNRSFQPTARHLGGANFAFVDGHVKFFPLPGTILQDDQLWDLK